MTRDSQTDVNEFRTRWIAFEQLVHSYFFTFYMWSSLKRCLFDMFCMIFFIKKKKNNNFWTLVVTAIRTLPRISTLPYLTILLLFEEIRFFSGFALYTVLSWLLLPLSSQKGNALENKPSKNWNFEKNLVQNVHPSWQWYRLAFLPHNNTLFLNFFVCRIETFVVFTLNGF